MRILYRGHCYISVLQMRKLKIWKVVQLLQGQPVNREKESLELESSPWWSHHALLCSFLWDPGLSFLLSIFTNEDCSLSVPSSSFHTSLSLLPVSPMPMPCVTISMACWPVCVLTGTLQNTADPWTTWVWTHVCIHEYMDFFSIINATVLHNLMLVESMNVESQL